MTITRGFGTRYDTQTGVARSYYCRDGVMRWSDNDQPLPYIDQPPGYRAKSPASPADIHPSAFIHRTAEGQRSAQILTDGAETHNLRVAELSEAWTAQHRTVCAHCIDRDTGERYILTATRISHDDGTPDVGA